MSSSVTNPSGNKNTKGERNNINASPSAKGKSKAAEEPMEEEEDDDDDDDMASGEEEDEEDEEEEEFEEIDPSVIVGRRTRGVKVDYTSKEALEKAGLKEDEGEDEDDEDVKMKD